MPPPGASEKAREAPSGDHWTPVTWSSREVTWRGKPPSVAIVHTWGTPVRLATKARREPSGEKLGEVHEPMRAMRATAAASSSAAGSGEGDSAAAGVFAPAGAAAGLAL